MKHDHGAATVEAVFSATFSGDSLYTCACILVFSKCFRAGYFTFSQPKFKINKGINL